MAGMFFPVFADRFPDSKNKVLTFVIVHKNSLILHP